jgi:integrase
MGDPEDLGGCFHNASRRNKELETLGDSGSRLLQQQEVNEALQPAARRRRERVEPNIYRRTAATGHQVFEIGFRDSIGRQRWRTVEGGITAARSVRADLLGRKARHERVSANPRLRFAEAADTWLAGPVATLRPATRAIYANAVETHLRPRWGRMRLDAITGDDVAGLVRDLRADGAAEWSIRGIIGALGRVYRHASTRLGWLGTNPTTLLSNGERPTTSATARRRIYEGDELAQTLAAARDPNRTLFALAAVTGARLSELLGLTWADLDLDDIDSAVVRIEAQVDRSGERRALKTAESRRTIEIPSRLAVALKRHQLASGVPPASAFVFATRSGGPLGQRNVLRALRDAQARSVDADGHATFPVLVQALEAGPPIPRDAAPNFHGFRHSAASLALASGESAEEVSWQLGHKNSVITRAVYVHEIRTVERQARRRARMEAQYDDVLAGLADARAIASSSRSATVPDVLPLWVRCDRCGSDYLTPFRWPIDRDPCDFIDVHPDYVPPCGHSTDPENLRVGVTLLRP